MRIRQGKRGIIIKILSLLLSVVFCIGILPSSALAENSPTIRAIKNVGGTPENPQVYYHFERNDGIPLTSEDILDCTLTLQEAERVSAPVGITAQLDAAQSPSVRSIRFFSGELAEEAMNNGDLSGAVERLTVSGGSFLFAQKIPLYALLEGQNLDACSVVWSVEAPDNLLVESGKIHIHPDTGLLSVKNVDEDSQFTVRITVRSPEGEALSEAVLPVTILPVAVKSAVLTVAEKNEGNLLIHLPWNGGRTVPDVSLTISGSNLNRLSEGDVQVIAKNGRTGEALNNVTISNINMIPEKSRYRITGDLFIPSNISSDLITFGVTVKGGEISCNAPTIQTEKLSVSLTGKSEVMPGRKYIYQAITNDSYTAKWEYEGTQFEDDSQKWITFSEKENTLELTIGESALEASSFPTKWLKVKASVSSRERGSEIPPVSAEMNIRLSKDGNGENKTIRSIPAEAENPMISTENSRAITKEPFRTGTKNAKSIYLKETTEPKYTFVLDPPLPSPYAYYCQIFNGPSEEALSLTDLVNGTKCENGILRITDDLASDPSDLLIAVQARDDSGKKPPSNVMVYRFSGIKLRKLYSGKDYGAAILPEQTHGSANSPADVSSIESRALTIRGAIYGDGRLYPSGGGTGKNDVNLSLNMNGNSELTVSAELRGSDASYAPAAANDAAPAANTTPLPVSVDPFAPSGSTGKLEAGRPIKLGISSVPSSGSTVGADYQILYTISVNPKDDKQPEDPKINDKINPNALVYDAESGIPLELSKWDIQETTTRKNALVRVKAVAVDLKNSGQLSDSVTFQYSLRKMGPPSIYPGTTDSYPAAIFPTTPITLSAYSNFETVIFYTTDGSNPTYTLNANRIPVPTGSTKEFTEAFTPGNKALNQFVVKAIALDKYKWSRNQAGYDSNYELEDSKVATFVYNLDPLEWVPEILSDPETSYENMAVVPRGEKITLTCTLNRADIYYTVDGTVPDPDDKVNPPLKYDIAKGILMNPTTSDGIFTVIAVARDISGQFRDSPVARFYFQLPGEVEPVKANPTSGEVEKDTEVVLSTETKEAVIYYEMGTEEDYPDDPDPEFSAIYSEPLVIAENETVIKAIAEKGGVSSRTATFKYTLIGQIEVPEAPVAEGATLSAGSKLDLGLEEDMQVVYTLDGSDPTDPANPNVRRGKEIIMDGVEGGSVTIKYYIEKNGKPISDVESITYFLADSETAVTSIPPDGSVVRIGDRITLSTTLTNAKFHYTTDGSDPTAESPEGNLIPVTGPAGVPFVVKVIAVYSPPDSGEKESKDQNEEKIQILTGSTPLTFTYAVQEQSDAPTASIPDGASILPGAQVELTAREGELFYTLDGSDPTTSSTVYTGPILLDKTVTLKAIAVAEGKAVSAVARYDYTLAGQVATPRPAIEGGEVVSGTELKMECATEGAKIYYTTDGSDPTGQISKNMILYDTNTRVTITRPVTIKMIAVREGLQPSEISVVSFTVISPPGEFTIGESEGEPSTPSEIDTLESRRQKAEFHDGPLFQDIQMKDPSSGVIVSAPRDSLQGDPDLQALLIESSSEDRDTVKNVLGYEIAALYEVQLIQDETPVEPLGEVEIGLPIPAEAANGVVVIARVNDDSTITTFPTRRVNGIAYAVTNTFSKYAVTVPQSTVAISGNTVSTTPVFIVITIILAAAVLLLVWVRLSRGKHGTDKRG